METVAAVQPAANPCLGALARTIVVQLRIGGSACPVFVEQLNGELHLPRPDLAALIRMVQSNNGKLSRAGTSTSR